MSYRGVSDTLVQGLQHLDPKLRESVKSLLADIKDIHPTLDSQGARLSALEATPSEFFDVRTFGGIPDGVHDSTPAIQRAIEAAQVVGGTVYLGPGTWRITSTLLIQAALTFQGTGRESTFLYLDSLTQNAIDVIVNITAGSLNYESIIIKDMTMTYNVALGSNISGKTYINFDPTNNCFLGGFRLENLKFNQYAGGALRLQDAIRTVVSNCIFDTVCTNLSQVVCSHTATGGSVEILITNCIFLDVSNVIANHASFEDTDIGTVQSCIFVGALVGVLCTTGGSLFTINGNVFLTQRDAGILIATLTATFSKINITSNILWETNAGVSAFEAITGAFGIEEVSFIGNICMGTTSATAVNVNYATAASFGPFTAMGNSFKSWNVGFAFAGTIASNIYLGENHFGPLVNTHYTDGTTGSLVKTNFGYPVSIVCRATGATAGLGLYVWNVEELNTSLGAAGANWFTRVTGNTQVRIERAGRYLITSNVFSTANGAGVMASSLRANTVNKSTWLFNGGAGAAGLGNSNGHHVIVDCLPNDLVDVNLASGTNRGDANGDRSYLCITKLN